MQEAEAAAALMGCGAVVVVGLWWWWDCGWGCPLMGCWRARTGVGSSSGRLEVVSFRPSLAAAKCPPVLRRLDLRSASSPPLRLPGPSMSRTTRSPSRLLPPPPPLVIALQLLQCRRFSTGMTAAVTP